MNILGIYDDHDSSAALYKNGQIVYACQEERITREKNQSGFPKNAVRECLTAAGLAVSDLDYVAFSSKMDDPFWTNSNTHRMTVADHLREQEEYWRPVLLERRGSDYFKKFIHQNLAEPVLKKYLKKYSRLSQGRDSARVRRESIAFNQSMRKLMFEKYFGRPKNFVFVDHHTSHAAWAYWSAPRDLRAKSRKSMVLTLDAYGDGRNFMISKFDSRGRVNVLEESGRLNIARFYKYCTLILGMKPLEHEFKVMGLAPYCKYEDGKNQVFRIYRDALWIKNNIALVSKSKPADSFFFFREKLNSFRFDVIAAGIQEYFQSFVKRIVELALKKYNADTIFFAGGGAMNVKANLEVSRLRGLRRFHVPASPGDDSTSIGACLAQACAKDPEFAKLARNPFDSIYLGHEIKKEEIERVIKKTFGDKAKFKIIRNITNRRIAQYLKADKVIARAAGRLEFGARALGNRSILANPVSAENVKRLNEKVKNRDFWMPFAPVILKEYANRYLVNPKNIPSPFMTFSFDTTPEGTEKLAAAKHPYDNSVRPQILSRGANPAYYDMVKEFGRQTGVYALINTSFNLHGHPIVRSARDAAEVFLATGIDGLILNDTLILKSKDAKST